jgi:hypothetical protein
MPAGELCSLIVLVTHDGDVCPPAEYVVTRPVAAICHGVATSERTWPTYPTPGGEKNEIQRSAI